jgi:hypothetical protein
VTKTAVIVGSLLLFWALSCQSAIRDYGVNYRTFVAGDVDDDILVNKDRNFMIVRVNLSPGTNITNLRNLATKVRAYGGRIQATLLPSLQDDSSCNQNFTTVQTTAYNETFALVDQVKDLIWDYEMLNEATHKSWRTAQVPSNSGHTASAYTGQTCYTSLAAGLRGMSNAINDIKNSSGFPLRRILGTTGRDWGFLLFATQESVNWDIVGYHIYPGFAQTDLLLDTWYGNGSGNVFIRLGQYGKPVTINEFNCQEIYGAQTGLPNFDNIVDSTQTNLCVNALKKHLTTINAQSSAVIESLVFYEMVDDTLKTNPEDRFGLNYTIANPKLQLDAVSSFTGGKVSKDGKAKLIRMGFLPDDICYP